MVNHSYIIVSIVYLYCHVKNRCALIHFACMVLYMCMCFFLVFIMVLYMCILSFVCLYYVFMYVTDKLFAILQKRESIQHENFTIAKSFHETNNHVKMIAKYLVVFTAYARI